MRLRLEGQPVLDQDPVCEPRWREASEITSGVASPSAWGQLMTRTVTTRTTASSRLPIAVHTTNVTSAAAVAT